MIHTLLRRAALTLAGLALILVAAVGCQQVRLGGSDFAPAPGTGLRVATHNVHYIVLRRETGRWSRGDFERRRPALAAAFAALDADIVAFQEMESFGGGSEARENLALDWLLSQNPGYAAAAVGEPDSFPITQPILYRTARLEVTDQGWFFFSDTPDVIYSRTFNGSYPAYATWAAFRDRTTGEAFRVVNVHFDYEAWENRRRSAELVAAPIADWEGPVILAGDLNARAGSPTMEILEVAGLTFPPVPGATFHFDRGLNLFGAIDHVGLRGAEALGPPMVLRESYDGVWPSDHYPVALDVSF
ncbi:endonuclease/exonuclease/phosphatase family protein [Wenxinia saemankumensis]|uniref:Metal-dependent hydrolase, endonuclease/exonuclease/phosphatase family n=1 Tax=Wenxinia saemankumensis TaxID=1447782 RepID=A0A1M6HC08_9RHOB|nr:endonuclease/exonuclease/phosphatase family protein [Wenxinia saemankumensis]SHJ19673.1 Metal-dependent hydrolase, endonuclease/exonuclease/phosphatase family [Wenxinia saemankumensis]